MLRKIFRVILFGLLALIVIPLIGALIFYLSGNYYLGGKAKACISYLEKHRSLIDRRADTISLADTTLAASRVVLLGDIHGYEDVQLLDDRFFIWLNRHAGTRYYIAELDSLRAAKLNTFLQQAQPDTVLLKTIVREIGLRIPQQAGRATYDKWMRLYPVQPPAGFSEADGGAGA